MLVSRLRQFVLQLPAGRRALLLVWRAARGWTVAWVLLLVAQGLLPAAQVLALRLLVNRLVKAPTWPSVGGAALVTGLLWLLGHALASTLSWVRATQAEKVQDEVHRLIHRQALALDLAFFDRAESYDLLHRARVDALSQPLALLENLGLLVQSSLGFLALAGILARYAPWLPLLLLLGSGPGILLVARQILKEDLWRRKHTPLERRARYMDLLITDRSAAMEVRIFDLGGHFRQTFEELRTILRKGKLTLVRDSALSEWLAGLMAWAASMAGLAWMLGRTLAGKVGLGDILLCFQAFQQGQGLLRGIMEGAGRIYRSLLFIEDLEAFLSLESGPGAAGGPVPAFQEAIRFEGVTFRYPESGHLALDGFDLSLPAGKVVAVVGTNGAGKSTLIKLLCRFYDPERGRILVDGRDLRELDPALLRRRITVLFQDPVNYQATVRDNIAFGDREAGEVEIEAAARAAGALDFVDRLPSGMATMLGKWFGGEELSGGEWQRVALARAFVRQSSLIILDEPTSAMDSWAEQEWLHRFHALAEGRTALIITHRFTTAMHADCIHVMDRGRVRESGTHAELLAARGFYAQSWAAQMRELDHA